MARVILHIGTHKTATTTLQNGFAANRALLAQHGLIYPDLGRASGHHGLVMEWVALPEVYALPDGPAATWAALADHAAEPGVLFLSSEEFSRGQPEPRVDFRRIRDYLAPFEGVEVVCTLRDQLSYLQSIYLEVSKKHVPPPWPTFLGNALTRDFAAGLYLNFATLDEHLRRAFGPEQIRYLDFAETVAAPGGILGRMLQLSGIDLAAGLRPTDAGAANVSPAPLAAWAANQIAAPWPAQKGLLALTETALRDEFGPEHRSTIYTRAEEARLIEHFAPLNEAFCALVDPVQPGFRLTPPRLSPNRIYREDIRPSFWLRIARRLHGRDRAA